MAEPIRTDILVPDAELNKLREDLLKAETNEERKRIQDAIAARKIAIAQAWGVSSIGTTGFEGTLLPAYNPANKGKLILQAAGPAGLYKALRIDEATDRNPYGTVRATDEGGNDLYFDAQGNPIDILKATDMLNAWSATGKGIGGGVPTSYAPGSYAASFYTGSKSAPSPASFVTGSPTGSPTGTPTGTATGMSNPYLPGTEAFKAFQERESAYNLLYQQMAAYGLQSLVEPLRNLVVEGVSPSEFTIRLRDTEAYKKRFAGNLKRVNNGLRALSEAEYIGLEDQYQDVMRRYGMPETYYKRGSLGEQEGFEQFISNDVSPVELEDRLQTAYNRVINANPEVGIALRNFYPEITNGDLIAYALDPKKTIDSIKRKITAAEIGGAAVQAGLTTNESDAQYLARYGITKEQAQQGYRTISGFLPRAQQLSSFYQGQVEGGPYTQASAEREVFNVPGAAEEERKRQRITSLEQAAFAGSSGLTGGALGRERAGQF